MRKLALALLLALFVPGLCRAATVEVRKIPSQAMKKEIPASFVLPDTYAEGKGPYPVVYLLDGFGGAHDRWPAYVKDLCDRYGIIAVCPNGATDSWYFDVPGDPNYQYETHVATEVVQFTDANYRTIKDRKGRAITGLSMGGHGALFLAMRHKDVFGAAGSMSGGVDIRPFPDNWNIKQRLGTIQEHPERWDEMTVVNQTPRIKDGDLAIIFDCGVNDFFLQVNRQLHEKLLKEKISHDYIERPGGHSWDYWRNSIQYQMLYFSLFFKRP